MRPIEGFLEDVKRKAGIKSDRELARRLGINPSAICHFRTGDSTPSQEHCKQLADLAGESFEKVLLFAQISKASELTKPAWERILKAAAKAGVFTLSLCLFSMASPAPVQAASVSIEGASLHKQASNIHYATYLRDRLRRFFRRFQLSLCPV